VVKCLGRWVQLIQDKHNHDRILAKVRPPPSQHTVCSAPHNAGGRRPRDGGGRQVLARFQGQAAAAAFGGWAAKVSALWEPVFRTRF
jgi:hypothetical protein